MFTVTDDDDFDESQIFYDADGNVMAFPAADAEPKSEVVLPTVNPKQLVNTTHEHVKKAIYYPEDGDLIFYVPQGWSVSVDAEQKNFLQRMILDGITSWQVDEDICTLTIDVDNTHTCRYFTASADMFENYDEEMEPSEDFPFFKPGEFNGCSHPSLTAQSPHVNHQCEFASNQNNCPIYTPQEWTVVSITKGSTAAGAEEVVELQRARRGYGIPVLRDVVDGQPSATTLEGHEERVAHLVEAENVELEEAPVTKTSFLEFVLT